MRLCIVLRTYSVTEASALNSVQQNKASCVCILTQFSTLDMLKHF